MSLFQFFLLIVAFNGLSHFILLFVSVNKKSPKLFIRLFFLPILLSAWFALTLQQINEVAYLSNRQILGNLLLTVWVLKSFYLDKPLKLALLSDFLNNFKNAVINNEFKRILSMIFYVSILQIICFSSVVSLNFLSGPSSFYWVDYISLIICIFGMFDYLKSNSQLKPEKSYPLKGLSELAMHPQYFGNLIFFFGLFLLSTSATGGVWSLIGPLTIIFLMHRVVIPENTRRGLSREVIHNQ